MKKTITSKTFISLSLVAFATVFTGCSDDAPAPKQTAAAAKASRAKTHNRFDHAHGTEVSDLEKHKFEHDFANQCVEREVHNSINKDNDRKLYEKPCMCIATFLLKDLTAAESEKFLIEHKNTQSLRIRFENAAYHCLQEKEQPKSPQIFGKH